MKVLLVGNPRTVMGFNRLTKIPSLNLASLAANVDEGLCEIKIADLVVKDRNPHKELQKVLNEFKPHVVGLTAMSFQYQTALGLAEVVRQYSNEVKIVMGGYHVTADSETIIQSEDMKNIDFLINGEGELPFNAFMKALLHKQDFEHVPGLSYRRNGTFFHNPRPEKLMAPEDIKIPLRSARIYKKGFHMLGRQGDVIETSRGCVYSCNFCSIRHMYGKSFRKFTIDRIITDLEDAKRYGARSIFITDDNITIDGKRLIELSDAIKKAKLDLHFSVQASVRGFKQNPGLAKALAESGTKTVFLGIENASDDNLEFMQKSNQLTTADTEQVVKELKQNGILVVGGFIFGNPDDKEEDLVRNFNFAKKIGIDFQLFNILTPHLKTELREDLIKEGLITNLTDYTKYNHYAANVRTRYLSAEELFKIRNKLEARFTVESGAIFRLFRAYPWFFTKLMFWMIQREPQNWFNLSTGFLRK
ncbi:MAG: B12-binding domain-containing radical SAM protein [Bacteroidales bacterium]|nr:B12-binding domain-containing radical SAM protein [Bacteroidales bacterium]MCF8403575.1 B12-binding domain-containing radical SAM protein [Bacteroidales bacterium]